MTYPTFEESGAPRTRIVLRNDPPDPHVLLVKHCNIVSTCRIGESVNVVELVKNYPQMFGRTSRASAIIRLHSPDTTCTLFARGKANIVGARYEIEALVCAWTCVALLRTRGVPHATVCELTVHNLTASARMGYTVDVVRMTRENSDICTAQFQLFPGVHIKSPRSTLTATIFRQGIINVTGSRTTDETREAYAVIQALLVKYIVHGEAETKRVEQSVEDLRKEGSRRAAELKRLKAANPDPVVPVLRGPRKPKPVDPDDEDAAAAVAPVEPDDDDEDEE